MYKRSGNTFQIVRISKTPCIYIYIFERALFTRRPLFASRKKHARDSFQKGGGNYKEYFEYALKGTPKGVF